LADAVLEAAAPEDLVKINDFVKKNCIFGAILTFLERFLQNSISENPMTRISPFTRKFRLNFSST
jgi:hypothetical protein